MSSPGWPATLSVELAGAGQVAVRPPRSRDARAWVQARRRNERHLAPWEGRPPAQPPATWHERNSPAVFGAMLRQQKVEARAGRLLPFFVTLDGSLCGAVTVGAVTRGAFDSGYVGYWVDEKVAGRGVATTALALVVEHCFDAVGLHRIEANVRPENLASRRVVDKLGFVQEGLHRRYLFIDEDWRDHVAYALLVDDPRQGVLRALAGRGPAG